MARNRATNAADDTRPAHRGSRSRTKIWLRVSVITAVVLVGVVFSTMLVAGWVADDHGGCPGDHGSSGDMEMSGGGSGGDHGFGGDMEMNGDGTGGDHGSGGDMEMNGDGTDGDHGSGGDLSGGDHGAGDETEQC